MKIQKIKFEKTKCSDHKIKTRLVMLYNSEGTDWHLDLFDWLFSYTIGFFPQRIQYWLWKKDIHWHDWINQQCTPDFSCCKHLITEVFKPIFSQLVEDTAIIKGKIENEKQPMTSRDIKGVYRPSDKYTKAQLIKAVKQVSDARRKREANEKL